MSPALFQSVHPTVLLLSLFLPLPSLSRLLISDTHFNLHRGQHLGEQDALYPVWGQRAVDIVH